MKGEKKVIEKTLIKVLAIFCIPLFDNKLLDYANADKVLRSAKAMLEEVGREDIVDKAKEHYRRNKDKIRF